MRVIEPEILNEDFLQEGGDERKAKPGEVVINNTPYQSRVRGVARLTSYSHDVVERGNDSSSIMVVRVDAGQVSSGL